MIHYYYNDVAECIFKIQGDGAYVYSKLTHTYERCNLYTEILAHKNDYKEISEQDALRLIRKSKGEDAVIVRQHHMKIHKAIAFASVAHAKQFRKATNIPYIVHPFEVAQILSEALADEDVICAGLLHDILEDTAYTAQDIEREFGSHVRELVEACTQECVGCWEDRKQHYIDYLCSEATLESMMISCADKLANIRSSKENYQKEGEAFWDRFSRGKDGHSWYFSKLIDAFYPLQNYDMFWELNSIYKELFVSCYRCGEYLYQSNGPETYVYHRGEKGWKLISMSNEEWHDEKYQKIEEKELERIVMQWELEL